MPELREEGADMAGERVIIVTSFNGRFEGIASHTVPRMQAYAERHGFDLQVTRYGRTGGRPYWMKITSIRRALDGSHDIVFWIDADALIVRLEFDVRLALPMDKDLGMVWHSPGGVDSCSHFNAGIIAVRNGTWSRDFFRRVSESKLKHHWQDQAAMLHLLGYDAVLGIGPDRPDAPDRAHLAHLDPAWNSIPGVASVRDPIIHHWAGIFGSARERGLAADAALIPLCDEHGEPARIAVAAAMNALADEARIVDGLEAVLRSPRKILRFVPAALRARIRQATIPRKWRENNS
ncbi:MAG: hypothetical protein R3D62_10530 [Xanthobacteraceae bacterium]